MRDTSNTSKAETLAHLSPAGYHIALRVGFAFPEFELNTYSDQWTEAYTRKGYMLDDPVMRWVYGNTGVIRWSALAESDPRGVLVDAARYGLRFGAVACVQHEGDMSLRSFGSFARSDREFSDVELETLVDQVKCVGQAERPENLLTEAEQEAFRLLSAGLMLKEIAFELGISESAVKQRLTNGRGKLSARTNMQAVMDATRFGWLD